MDELLKFVEHVVGVASGHAIGETLWHGIRDVLRSHPEIAGHLASRDDFERGMDELAGQLEALAGTGRIAIDRAVIVALRSARFDHQDGTIHIGNSTVEAPTIIIGGGERGAGHTRVDGTSSLRASGAGIETEQGASVTVEGNASIKIGK